jgi:hypothetical protein
VGLDCDVPDVAAVVFAHVHATADVWLNVVANPSFARVNAAVAFWRLLHAVDLAWIEI